jgi:hypothetical protein
MTPLRDQPAALICRHLELLDRALDRGLLVGGSKTMPTGFAGVPLRW